MAFVALLSTIYVLLASLLGLSRLLFTIDTIVVVVWSLVVEASSLCFETRFSARKGEIIPVGPIKWQI